MKRIFSYILIWVTLSGAAQEVKKDTIIDDLIIIKGDSAIISLDEVVVLNKLKFDSTKERRYYYWYWKKVQKAYPYAKLGRRATPATQ